jgi:Fe-S oxidoreductase
MCNGAGVCRKTAGGTMCPSYRATRDERHATRGRGNALRLAITGQVAGGASRAAWNDPETLETLDLCLSCKACKSECPSNVDVAKLKAEYLAQGYEHGARPPLRARAFGAVRALNRLGSIAPGFANAVNRFPPVRAILNGVLGLDPRRTLPPFSASLYRWADARRPRVEREAPAVVLLPDCFTVHNEAAIGRAAVRVLETLGYRVVLPRTGCCGRALISGGLLRSAARVCAGTARALARACADAEAVALVALEPSCLSAVTDDWPDLEMDVDRGVLADLAERSMLVEDFIESRWAEHPRPVLAPPSGAGPVLVHGHCHQKTLWGVEGTLALLGRAVGPEVELIDSTCCGMAGSFGYTRDHYDLSIRIAELALFPAIRAAPDAVVAAAGTSCRHQIRDGLGRAAVHPIELVARKPVTATY